MIRLPIEFPNGNEQDDGRRMRKPYCSRNGRIWYSVRRSMNANITFEPSSGGIGMRLKIISSEVDPDEEDQDLDDDAGRRPAVARMYRSGMRGDRREHEVRERSGGRHDRLAPRARRRGSSG